MLLSKLLTLLLLLPHAALSLSPPLSRRSILLSSPLLPAAFLVPAQATAAGPRSVLVAGATGQTGRKILQRLAADPGFSVAGGVRDPAKAAKVLSESSILVRGAMVDSVKAVDIEAVDLLRLDVVQESVEELAKSMKGVDSLVIAVGFVRELGGRRGEGRGGGGGGARATSPGARHRRPQGGRGGSPPDGRRWEGAACATSLSYYTRAHRLA
jgi:hypothetical protein